LGSGDAALVVGFTVLNPGLVINSCDSHMLLYLQQMTGSHRQPTNHLFLLALGSNWAAKLVQEHLHLAFGEFDNHLEDVTIGAFFCPPTMSSR